MNVDHLACCDREWCISDPYGTTVTIGGKEEIEALIEELQRILEEPDGNEE